MLIIVDHGDSMSKETRVMNDTFPCSQPVEEEPDEVRDSVRASVDEIVETFALPSLYREEHGFVAWENSHQSNLRICFAREKFAAKVADEWTQGTVVTLSSADHEPIELYHNERLIARGILVTKRGRIGIKVTQLVDVRHSRNAA